VGSQFPREDVVWLLGSLSQLHRIPFDPALILQQFPPPYSLVTLIEAARARLSRRRVGDPIRGRIREIAVSLCCVPARRSRSRRACA